MKKLSVAFALFSLVATSTFMKSQNYYQQQWKTIESNQSKGLLKSNLSIIENIINQSIKDKNVVELVNALKAKFNITNRTSNDKKNDNYSRFLSEIQKNEAQLKGESRLIMKMLLVRYFEEYFDDNRWKIDGRTQLSEMNTSELETWTRLDFKNYISKHYSELSKHDADLQKISMKDYKDLFGKNADYEFVSNLLEFKTISNINFLKNSGLFTDNELEVNEKTILALYDKLIATNIGNSKLYFQHQKINYECERNHCKNTLELLENLYNSSTIGDYKVLIADDIVKKLNYDHKNIEAMSWIKKAQQDYPKSIYINSINNRENIILMPLFFLKYDNTVPSNQPIPWVVEFQNMKEISLNIYSVNKDYGNFLKFVGHSSETNFSQISKTLVRKDNFNLPENKDYNKKATTLQLAGLPAGVYVGECTFNNKVVSRFYFLVNNTRIIKQEIKKNQNTLYKLVDRNNGENALSKKIEIYQFQNDQLTLIETKTLDQNANFVLPKEDKKNYYDNYLIRQVETNELNILYADRYYDDDYNQPNNKYLAQIFLDRAIYRPGQTVCYKVIATQWDKLQNKESVLKNTKLKITLKDTSDEILNQLTVTTNEFGSVNGTFLLPTAKLNGNFNILVESLDGDNIYNEKQFRVEEYKRPNFEVSFEKIKDEYKYGQTIEIKGKANSYSGIPLSNAEVKYNLRKEDVRWKYFFWLPRASNENYIVGTTKTNDKGEFSIKVKLEKDETLEGIQIDNYTINAEVTDINGETQSDETNLVVSSVTHRIEVEKGKEDYFADEPIKLEVLTKNFNDQTLKKSYKVELNLLSPDERVFRSNFKDEIQNLPKYPKAEFVKLFPHDYYLASEKDNKIQQKLLERVQEPQDHNTLDLGQLKPGKYLLKLYNVEGKDSIITQKRFEVWDKTKLEATQKPFLKVLQEKSEYARKEKASFYIYSGIPDAVLNIFVQDGNGNTQFLSQKMENGFLKYSLDIPTDAKVQQLSVQFQLVAYNDVQTTENKIRIKSDKVPLKIEMITFRDKILPNTKEKWSIKVSGDHKDKISAEVLANMYDQSLDKIIENNYRWDVLGYIPFNIYSYQINKNLSNEFYYERLKSLKEKSISLPWFSWFKTKNNIDFTIRGVSRYSESNQVYSSMPSNDVIEKRLESVVVLGYSKTAKSSPATMKKEELNNIKVRENLNETAFFYPNLLTDSKGNVSFEFTSPEALTQWKLMFLAHTQDANVALLEKMVITQKDFSVIPNYPRFLREGDQLVFKSKIANLTANSLTGMAQIQILDAETNQDISSEFNVNEIQKSFEVLGNNSTLVEWNIKVPNNRSSIIIKTVAKSGHLSDGEQKAIPILSNRILVTDAQPIFVKEGQNKTFVLDALKNNSSTTTENVSATLELTTQPIWEVIFALPSLKNDTHLSADVVFNKWFADVLATEIMKANPRVKTIFDEYNSKGLLVSNLEKNQELKQLLLDETPWVLDAKNEKDQMQKLSRLFDLNTMQQSLETDWKELEKLQNPDGGFSWYSGYPSSFGTSLYILKNLGKLDEWLKEKSPVKTEEKEKLIRQLIQYVDKEMFRYWDMNKDNIWSNYAFNFLDSRHYWEANYPLKGKSLQLKNQVIEKSKTAKITDFTFFGLHRAALLFDAYQQKNISKKLLTYLKETSVESDNQGVFWKNNFNDWGWYSSSIVNHAGAIEAFQKLSPDDLQFIEEMKIWLVTQKEVSHWDTSRSTAEVIFTMLNSGKSWTNAQSDAVEIIWGGQALKPDTKATGYVKQSIISNDLDKKWATVTVNKSGAGVAQGGLFWKYYEDIDKVQSSENYISITKELYRKITTENGEVLEKITEKSPLKVGDKVTVRMILNTDRDMEFIHLKDMRAAGFEPISVLSGYQWKNNLAYYQSTKDASTNFYIEYMPKGKYVFEYDYICNAAGTFSNGMATLQNYYAPQMNAHSKGDKVMIKDF